MNHIWKTASVESSKIVLLYKYSLDNVTMISAQKIQVNLVNLLIIVLHDIYHHTFLIFTDVNWFKIHSKSPFFQFIIFVLHSSKQDYSLWHYFSASIWKRRVNKKNEYTDQHEIFFKKSNFLKKWRITQRIILRMAIWQLMDDGH